MDRFERFMEAWGLLTMDWMRSSRWYRRWAGVAIGAVACWLMALMMLSWSAIQAIRALLRRVLGSK